MERNKKLCLLARCRLEMYQPSSQCAPGASAAAPRRGPRALAAAPCRGHPREEGTESDPRHSAAWPVARLGEGRLLGDRFVNMFVWVLF